MKTINTLTILLLAFFAFNQDYIQKIDSTLNELYANQRINGNVLIAENGTVCYNKSFGLANITKNKKLDENSVFDLASVTKQLTAAGVVLLKEQGKLSYDDPISKHLPELAAYDKITIKHLLQHTSGLPDYMEVFEKTFDAKEIATNKDVIAYLANDKPALLFESGSSWAYCNTGYVVLAQLIEKISGMPYAKFMQQHIFKPLKMKQTFVKEAEFSRWKKKKIAVSYSYSEQLKRIVPTDSLEEYTYIRILSGVVGDGGIHSNVVDVLKWSKAVQGNSFFSEEAKKEMFAPTIMSDGSVFDYGFGWQLDRHEAIGNIISHTGGWGGYRTLNEIHLDANLIIVVLLNLEQSEMINTTLRYAPYGLTGRTNRTEVTLSKEQLQKVAGVYEIEEGMAFTIKLEGDELYAEVTGQSPLRIYPESEHTFFFKALEATLHFEINEVGIAEKLTFSQGEFQLMGTKKP